MRRLSSFLVALELSLFSPFWKAAIAMPSETFGRFIRTLLNLARKSLSPSPTVCRMEKMSLTLASALFAPSCDVMNLSAISSNVEIPLTGSWEYYTNAPTGQRLVELLLKYWRYLFLHQFISFHNRDVVDQMVLMIGGPIVHPQIGGILKVFGMGYGAASSV